MIEMVKINVTVKVPSGDYCDVCTKERVDIKTTVVPGKGFREVRNKINGTWDYRCSLAAYVNPKPFCAVYGSILKEAAHIPGDPIAHRLEKCAKCKEASRQTIIDLREPELCPHGNHWDECPDCSH